MEILTRSLLLAAALAAAPASAQTCYSGSADSGQLTFEGAVEGTGFTGTFGAFDVEYCLPEAEPAAGKIRVGIDLASADTDNDDRDQTLMGPEFFAVEAHPRARWVSTAIESAGEGFRAEGELTLKGITRPQAVRFTISPDGEGLVARGGFTLAGSADVDRQRFDVGTGEFADPEFVRNRVDVAFEVRLSRGD
jgi:polyisoprenoid-binding protein YceI